MSSLSVGVLGGLIFGVIAVLNMLPLEFADKPAALVAAFLRTSCTLCPSPRSSGRLRSCCGW
jgi:hypothetical protein